MKPERFALPRYQFLQNPIWYIVTLIALSGLTFRLGFLWWLVPTVALVWGIGLIWDQFRDDGMKTTGEDSLRTYLERSARYKGQIDRALQASGPQRRPVQRQALIDQINRWIAAIEELVAHIASLRDNELIQQDLTAVPQAIDALQTQLEWETDGSVRAELRRALTNRQHQLTVLESLENAMRRAEIQVENTLSLLGTIYSQILAGSSTHHVADYARLATDIEEEVRCVQDQLEALWEVKGCVQFTMDRTQEHKGVFALRQGMR